MLLFAKAQHSLKLIVYLKVNKDVDREKIVSFNLPDSMTAAKHTCPTCHHTFRAQIGLITDY